jgi:hypothetical protein
MNYYKRWLFKVLNLFSRNLPDEKLLFFSICDNFFILMRWKRSTGKNNLC